MFKTILALFMLKFSVELMSAETDALLDTMSSGQEGEEFGVQVDTVDDLDGKDVSDRYSDTCVENMDEWCGVRKQVISIQHALRSSLKLNCGKIPFQKIRCCWPKQKCLPCKKTRFYLHYGENHSCDYNTENFIWTCQENKLFGLNIPWLG